MLIIVAVRTRLHVDILAIVVSIGYLLSFLLRLPIWPSQSGMTYFTSAAFLIVWGSMYYFVFEMKKLYDVLNSDGP